MNAGAMMGTLRQWRVRLRRSALDVLLLVAICTLPMLLPAPWPVRWLAVAVAAVAWMRLADAPVGRREPGALSGARTLLAIVALAGAAILAADGSDVLRALALAALFPVGAMAPRPMLPWACALAALLFGPLGGHASIFELVAFSLASPLVLHGGFWREQSRASSASSQPKGAEGTAPSTQSENTDAIEARLSRAADRAVRRAVQRTLEVLRASLRGESALYFRLDDDGNARLSNAEFAGEQPIGGPFDGRGGLFGLLRSRESAVALNALMQDEHFLPWDSGGRSEGHLLGTAIRDEGLIRGFLVVQREAEQPDFSDIDRIALEAAAEQLVAVEHTERLLHAAGRDQARLERTHAALASLQTALSAEEVCAIARDILRREVAFDFLAFTSADEEGGHRVIWADGKDADQVQGAVLPDEDCLIQLAARRGHSLPWGGRIDRTGARVFGLAADPLEDVSAVLILPMTLGNRALGTLVLADSRREAFDSVPRESIEVLLHCIAGALANAFTLANMVRRATTDGMTGLLNHAALKNRGAEALARAERSGAPLSLIMVDLDHFKVLNDTWGHAAGDDALRAAADALRDRFRRTDIVARYGGEEFAVLLEQTGAEEAAHLAETVREAIEAIRFQVGDSDVPLSASLGVACTDDVPGTLSELFEAADQALYAAKHGGRNQVAVAAPHVRAA